MKAIAFTNRYNPQWQKCKPMEIPSSRQDRLAFCNMRGLTALKLENDQVFVAASIGDGQARTAVSVEDHVVVHYVITREGLADLTRDGSEGLNVVLALSGFYIGKPIMKEEHNDGQVEFWQAQGWN